MLSLYALVVCVCVKQSLATDLEQCMRLLSRLMLVGRQIVELLGLIAGQAGDCSQQGWASHAKVAVADMDVDSSEGDVLV